MADLFRFSFKPSDNIIENNLFSVHERRMVAKNEFEKNCFACKTIAL